MASTANVSCLSIPEAKSLRPRFLQEQFLLTAVREGLAPGRLSWLAGEGILPGLSSHCFPSTYVSSSCGFVFKDISQIGSGAHSSPACSVDQLCLILATPWTVAHQAPLSMGFFRQEYWSGLPFPSPGDLPDPGIEPISPALQADSLLIEPPGNPGTLLRTSKSFLLCIFFSLEWTCL